MGVPFISEADLESYLKIDATVLDSHLASIALDSGCTAVTDFCNQEILAVTGQVVRSPLQIRVNPGCIILPNFPITTFTSLTQDTVVVDPLSYTLLGDEGLLMANSGYSFSQTSYYVATYNYGYTAVPATPRIVALQVAMRVYEFAMYREETIGPLQAAYAEGAGQLTDSERDALYPYRSMA